MASVQEEEALTIQLVYDGPPEAGKTASIRALARSFGRTVHTPEEENGRTVFFDWLEHTGGRFDGAPIRFQMASVPGQRRWRDRRQYFLDRADAIIFVGDTTAAGFPASLERLRELEAWVESRDSVPIGVVFQANRRDAPDALPMATVRQQISSERIAIVESVAIDGSGVRETFVFAVRLALDRIRELRSSGTIDVRERCADSDEVLRLLRSLDEPSISSDEQSGIIVREPALRPPTQDLPSGLVWPPVDGRVILREATRQGGRVVTLESGDCSVDLGNDWQAHSHGSAWYADLDGGRAALVDWARMHVCARPLLSARRCVALAETGQGGYRLWQVVHREPSLRDLFGDGLEGTDARSAARLLAIASRLLTEARAVCTVASLPLACTLDTVGVSETDRPTYIGLVPQTALSEPAGSTEEAVANELASLLRDCSPRERAHVREAVQSVHPTAFGVAGGDRVMELLTALLAS